MKKKVKKKVMIRSYRAGVFIGILSSYDPATRHAVLKDSRRMWYWSGAASLSQLATDGTSNPGGCKFPCVESGDKTVAEVIEIIPMTEKAWASIAAVPIWKQ